MKCKGSESCPRVGNPRMRGFCEPHWHHDRRKRMASGEWAGHVPAAPAISRLAELQQAGVSIARIARVTGLSTRTLFQLPKRERVWSTTADKIMAIQVDATPNQGEASGYVPAIGTRRRLQSLEAIGYMRQYLAERLGVSTFGIERIVLDSSRVERVQVATAQKVHALWRELQLTPSKDRNAARVRKRSAKRGWAPPLTWDEDSIDDPNAEPVPERRDGRLSALDWHEEYRDLRDMGMGLSKAAERMGLTQRALEMRLERSGLAA